VKLETKFDITDKIVIDGDRSIKGIIAAITVRGPDRFISYQACWWDCGVNREDWFPEWRLSEWVE
jgi:hypothetical protein